jgi:hypothetical protein
MHVATGRHLDLIESMKKCFSGSQIVTTTHSHLISKHYGDRSQLYDLRLIYASDLVKQNPWRLYLQDEITEALAKIRAMSLSVKDATEVCSKTQKEITAEGEKLLQRCLEKSTEQVLLSDAENFLKQVEALFVRDNYIYYSR